MQILNILLFIVLPYLTLFVLVFGTIYRYKQKGFTVTSLSSEFLEGKKLFWGVIPFHFGLLFLFFGHLFAFLIPEGVLAWNSRPVRLLVLEFSSFIFGLAVLYGLIRLLIRRATTPRIRVVSTPMDYIMLVLLLAQVVFGLWIALEHRWGSSWFASVLTPYLNSIFLFNPDITAVSNMAWPIKAHIVGAYLVFLMIPFSRLMHLLVVPIQYIWRPYQQVIWNVDPRLKRTTNGHFKNMRPKNN